MNNTATQPADALGEVADGYPKTISLSDQEVEIRVFGTQDRAQVLAFAQALPEQDLLFLRLDITEPDIVDAWLANVSSGATFSLCAYAGDEFVGYATVERNPARWTRRVGEIRVNVAPSLRSHGLGRILTSQIFDIARAMGLKKLVAHMTPDQAGAQAAFIWDIRTSFEPSPTTTPSLTTTAPNGPPRPCSTPSRASSTARCM